MVNQLYLHLGPPKTGSTTLQRQLHQHAAPLLAQGILYPKGGRLAEGQCVEVKRSGGKHTEYGPGLTHNLVGWWLENKVTEGAHLAQKVVSALAEELTSTTAHTAVLSGEGLFWLQPNHWDQFLEPLQLPEVKVIWYDRDPWKRARSLYSQAVKMGKTTLSYPQYLREHLPETFRYHFRQVHRLTKYFGEENVIVKSFDDRVAASDLVRDFFITVGVDLSKIDIDEAATNARVSPSDIQVLLAINRIERRLSGALPYGKLRLGIRSASYQRLGRPIADKLMRANQPSQADRDYLNRMIETILSELSPSSESDRAHP